MNLVEWYWAQRAEIEAATADAQHMLEKYGDSAPQLCRDSINAVTDRKTKRSLQQILKVLNAYRHSPDFVTLHLD